MPATAGRIRMPANNRLSVSDSLKSSEIWQKSVGYDPYAPAGAAAEPDASGAGVNETSGQRQRLLIARAAVATGGNYQMPGACTRCGQVGHLRYQCRNAIVEEPVVPVAVPVKKAKAAPNLESASTVLFRLGDEKDEKSAEGRDASSEEKTAAKYSDKPGRLLCRSRRRRRYDHRAEGTTSPSKKRKKSH